MNRYLRPDERERVRQLADLRQRNNEIRWRLGDYLNDRPRSITAELLAEIDRDGALPEEMAYVALLASLCGLDPAAGGRDLRLVNDYLRPAVRRLDASSYRDNPYYRNVRIPEVRLDRWQLTHGSYRPYEAFVRDDLEVTEDFREIPPIGYFAEAFRFPVVREQGREWMAVKPSEIETMRPAIDAAHGKVVVFGLGLGYFPYMASGKDSVTKVTVVERDPEVIRLFRRVILPQFPGRNKVEVVADEALAYAGRRMSAGGFDCAFVDLWHDAADGLAPYVGMKQRERLSPETTFHYWVEETLLSALRWRLFDRVVDRARSFGQVEARLGKTFLRRFAARERPLHCTE
ncbi:MAG TPA: hypothetical protein PKK12_02585 [Candidatus Aminicenantes bacterium]|nr:hypothetical protein [Candidatus Aminicenantes bacterium]